MGRNLRDKPSPAQPSSTSDVDAFLSRLAAMPKSNGGGRLIFAIDATASREPTWDRAMHIQADMFQAAAGLGGLSVQLAYYRGFGEFRAAPWSRDAASMIRRMTGVRCLGGRTQIRRVLRHALAETRRQKVNALVFVGDCMEEDIDQVCDAAGHLGLEGVPAFMFHEGDDSLAVRTFSHVARLTRGACCRFDAASADQLRDLLRVVAVYAAGGYKALTASGQKGDRAALQLAHLIDG